MHKAENPRRPSRRLDFGPEAHNPTSRPRCLRALGPGCHLKGGHWTSAKSHSRGKRGMRISLEVLKQWPHVATMLWICQQALESKMTTIAREERLQHSFQWLQIALHSLTPSCVPEFHTDLGLSCIRSLHEWTSCYSSKLRKMTVASVHSRSIELPLTRIKQRGRRGRL